MKWIHHLSNSKTPFYIYRLNKGDAIIQKSYNNDNKSIIILHGIVHLIQIFTNKEIISLAILNRDHIINIRPEKIEHKYYYYKIVAIEDTYLISFIFDELLYKNNNSTKLLINIIKGYELTLHRYKQMNHILVHKHIKQRVTQLILFLCEEFGIIYKQKIIIPFKISQITIGTITGSNKVTINKIVRYLYNEMFIQYYGKKIIYITNPFLLNSLNLNK
uniref:Global nitrogen transcriptional regulator n=1 Tax=Inkyuleea mariana TaxID=123988 RepID=A0A4D6WZW4_9FLOR|nr:global nitrogen transcriptional regulator [Inkyuleea mariana]